MQKGQRVRFHIIGDIAIVSIPPEMDDQKRAIAEMLILRGRNIKTVLNKISKIEGDGRVALFEILAGSDTVTTHREFGHSYRLDVAKVFFNGRLGYERRRVASLVMPSERILIPFCGIGPFAVPSAFRGARVVAIESSPEACRWLAENARINGVEDDIAIIKGDAFSTAQMLRTEFDRAIVPTPYGRDEILEIVAPMVKKGGMVHFYTFKKRHQIEGLIEKYESLGLDVELFRKCGNVAPGVSRWAFDLRLR